MGVYTRYKKAPDGLRQLVQLLESTPIVRRQKMIDVGMAEDPDFTQKAMQYILSFKDVLELPDGELAEVIADNSPELTGFAIHSAGKDIKEKFLRLAPLKKVIDLKDALDLPATPQQIGGAQAKMIELTRKLEKKGIVKTKRIPI